MADDQQNPNDDISYDQATDTLNAPAPGKSDVDIFEGSDLDPDRLMAVLSYVGILVLIPLFVSRDNDFVMFHAKQGLVILVGLIAALVIGQWLAIIGTILFVMLLLVDVVGILKALSGHRWKIPVIGEIAKALKL